MSDDTTTPDPDPADTEEPAAELADASPAEPVDPEDQGDEGATFPRDYVEKLRRESARYRDRARSADVLGQRLHTELVRATGRLADPSDLAFDETHLEDPDALASAIEDLLARKPHLASRRPTGEIGQGATKSAPSVDLAGLLRKRAG